MRSRGGCRRPRSAASPPAARPLSALSGGAACSATQDRIVGARRRRLGAAPGPHQGCAAGPTRPNLCSEAQRAQRALAGGRLEPWGPWAAGSAAAGDGACARAALLDGARVLLQVAPLGQPTRQLALSAHDLAALAAQVAGLAVRARLAQLTRGPASWVQAPHLCGSRHRRLGAGKESAVAGLSSASRRRGLSSRQKMATSKRRHPEALDGRTG